MLLSLRTKYLSAVLGTVIVALSLTAWHDYRRAESVLLDMNFASGRAFVSGLGRELSLLFSMTRSQLSVFTTRDKLRELVLRPQGQPLPQNQREKVEQGLRDAATGLPGAVALLLFNARGEVIASSDREGYGISRFNQPYFQKAMQGQIAIDGPIRAPGSGRSVCVVAVPVLVDGQTRGVLAATLNLDQLGRLLIDPVSPLQLPRASLFILSPTGRVVMHGQRALIHADWSNTELYEQVKKNVAGLFPYTAEDGTAMIGICTELPTGWHIVATAPHESVYGSVSELRNSEILVTCAAIVVVGVLLYFLIGRLCRDLMRGVRFAESVAAGNLDQRLVFKRNDELGVLATALTSMVETLKQAITVSEKRARELEAITDGIAGGVAKVTFTDTIGVLWGNPAFYQLSGRTKEEYERDMHESAVNIIHPEDYRSLRSSILRQAGKRDTLTLTYRILKKDGSICWSYLKARYIEDKNGLPVFLGVFMDITPKILAMQALEIEQQRYQALTELSDDILFEYDVAADTVTHTDKIGEVFGKAPVILSFKSSDVLSAVVHPEDMPAFAAIYDAPSPVIRHLDEVRLKHRDGEYHWYHCALMYVFNLDGKQVRCIGKLANIDRHKLKEKLLLQQAQIDGLTGCYNKTTTEVSVDKAISEDEHSVHALYVIDIDDFKQANDRFGHAFGDATLRWTAALLQSAFRSTDLCGRIGGDEFVVFARDIRSPENAVARLEALYARLADQRVDRHTDYRVSLSAGVCLYPTAGGDFAALYKAADEAMYKAKHSGKGRFEIYTLPPNQLKS